MWPCCSMRFQFCNMYGKERVSSTVIVCYCLKMERNWRGFFVFFCVTCLLLIVCFRRFQYSVSAKCQIYTFCLIGNFNCHEFFSPNMGTLSYFLNEVNIFMKSIFSVGFRLVVNAALTLIHAPSFVYRITNR